MRNGRPHEIELQAHHDHRPTHVAEHHQGHYDPHRRSHGVHPTNEAPRHPEHEENDGGRRGHGEGIHSSDGDC